MECELREERKRQERLRTESAMVGVVLLKCIKVAYRFRQCSPQRTIASAASQQMWYDGMQCTDMRLQQSSGAGGCVSRFPQTKTHWPTSPGYPPPARAVKHHPRLHASSSASITHIASLVDHSTHTQVPRYCILPKLAVIFLVSVDIRLACRSSILPISSRSFVSSHVFPPRHPLWLSQVPACRRQRTVRDRLSSLRYSDSEKRFRICQPHSLYTKSSFTGQRQHHHGQQQSQPSRRCSYLHLQQCASSSFRPCLELCFTYFDVLQLVPACLHVLTQVISFEVRRHDAAKLCDSS